MKIPIVNEQNEIIKYIDRDEKTHDDIVRVTNIWIIDENDNILLQQRSFNKSTNPGKWGPAAAGTVEEGESYELNAYKELEEELGISGFTLNPFKKFFGETRYGKRFAQVYTAQIPHDTQFTIQQIEVEKVAWFSKIELRDWYKKEPDQFVGLMKDLQEFFFK